MNVLSNHLYKGESESVAALLKALPWPASLAEEVQREALQLVEHIRRSKRRVGGLEAFLQQYALDTEEGLALMCLAEALLRIPDSATRNMLIRDKIAAANWLAAAGDSSDWIVKASGVGLMLGRATLGSVVSKLGEPVIREAMVAAMRVLGQNFVLGRDIEEAFKNARAFEEKGYRMSYDMLGEGARTREDAGKYYQSYREAITYIGKHADKEPGRRAGISVKLSALHPRYEYAQSHDALPEMIEIVKALAAHASAKNVAMTIDAEESERLEMSLRIIEAVMADKALTDWEGFGMAVQAYQKRALPLIQHMEGAAKSTRRRLQMRLVKGAYWDREIKQAQIFGLPDYPVYTRKANTDLSFLACAHVMLSGSDHIYPMLATHNAHSVAAILKMAGNYRDHDKKKFEFQRLHGMGEALYDHVIAERGAPVSVYAPVGPHQDLLAYLVRRLLENGANSSFVNRLLDEIVPASELARDPVKAAVESETKRHPRIALPKDIYGARRVNSAGLDLNDEAALTPRLAAIKKHGSPYRDVPDVPQASAADIERAFGNAAIAFAHWAEVSAENRARALEKCADLIEENAAELMALCVYEAGKTLPDALAEIREAVDFCRYYAARGRDDFSEEGTLMQGPTGERNRLILEPRGTFVCISPWNFPLAIFTGQVAAALMAGNCVIAKPAEQTPRIAQLAVKLMHRAGIPSAALQLLCGDGKTGAAIVAHKAVAGVAFTGSTVAAHSINRALAAKDGPIVPLIAETGGQNAMIVDSSALPEQVVDDVITSAFGSAGQRCSALRVLYLQEDTADKIIEMLKGAMAELKIGEPDKISTDIGPVIDEEAWQALEDHRKNLEKIGKLIAETPMPKGLGKKRNYFAPCAYEIPSMKVLDGEHFGPILHVVRYGVKDTNDVIEEINASGFGLTFGLHSRIDSFTHLVARRIKVGNVYVNRSTIGAVVGVQPFGGRGLSGTGPKAGGPHYLPRFATEKVISVDTTAAGGNASLVSLGE